MASWLTRIAASSGKSSRRRSAICCGLHAIPHRRFRRGPCRRPFQGTAGPGSGAPHPGRRHGPPTAPARRPVARRSARASPAWGGGPTAPRATGRWAPGTPGRHRASRRCAVALARSSTAPAPGGGPPPAARGPAPARARSPPARRTTGTAPRAASTTATDATVACRPPHGTSGSLPAATPPPPSPRPRSTDPPRWTPRTAADPLAAPPPAAPATSAYPAGPDPSAADLPSQHPPPVLRRPLESAQYASKPYRAILARHGITQSMSRKGDCLDSAPMESFFGSLKNELVHRTTFPTREAARRAIFEYVEAFYNRRRRHSGLGFLTPAQAHEQMAGAGRLAANRNTVHIGAWLGHAGARS